MQPIIMYANTKNGSPEVPDIHRKALSKKMSHADVMYERAALIKVFKALDADGNGVLTTISKIEQENNEKKIESNQHSNDPGRVKNHPSKRSVEVCEPLSTWYVDIVGPVSTSELKGGNFLCIGR